MRNFLREDWERRGISETACQRLHGNGKKGVVRAGKPIALIQSDAKEDKAKP
jgi:hypothetical protein